MFLNIMQGITIFFITIIGLNRIYSYLVFFELDYSYLKKRLNIFTRKKRTAILTFKLFKKKNPTGFSLFYYSYMILNIIAISFVFWFYGIYMFSKV